MLEAQRVGIIRHQLIVFDIIAEIHSGHLSRRQTGAVPPILQLVVVDVGHVPYLLVVVYSCIVGIIDRDESRRILHVYQIVLICAVVYGDIVPAVVLVIVEIVLGVFVLREIVIIVIVCGVIIIPGLEIGAVAVFIGDIIGGVLVQEVRQLNVRLIIVGIVGRVMDRVEGPVIAVNDLGIGRIAATIIVGHIPGLVHHAAGNARIVILRLVHRVGVVGVVYRIPGIRRAGAVVNPVGHHLAPPARGAAVKYPGMGYGAARDHGGHDHETEQQRHPSCHTLTPARAPDQRHSASLPHYNLPLLPCRISFASSENIIRNTSTPANSRRAGSPMILFSVILKSPSTELSQFKKFPSYIVSPPQTKRDVELSTPRLLGFIPSLRA